jgi:hypothetical protein
MANKSFELKFNMDNEAFDHYPKMMIDRALNEVRTALSVGKFYGNIKDINGNTIGCFKVKGIKSWE